ncbi:MAG: hypothetical protein JWN52_7993, partial [Actinomycetia bacterium]|nr:hypothetical protein [Actinomycetes bacterium]
PTDIQTTLHTPPHNTNAHVTVYQPPHHDQRLIAYFVTDLTTAELRDYCAHQLPAYMVPAQFVRLDSFPLTPNGKIDRHNLPTPADQAESPYAPPQTPTEQTLATLWAQILGRTRIGRHDNFFALGGHSLNAARLQSRLGSGFGVEVPLRVIFETADLQALAKEISRLKPERSTPRPEIARTARSAPLPLSPAQRRLWFLEQWQPGTPLYHIAGTLRLSGFLDAEALLRSCQMAMDRHESLRTRLIPTETEPLQAALPHQVAPFSVIDLSSLQATVSTTVASHLARLTAETPFALTKDPLWRVVLLRLSPTEHLLAICVHHLIGDGHSLSVLMAELSSGYDRATRGTLTASEPPPIQYGDYVVWQQARLQGEQTAEDLAYWSYRLSGVDGLLLPTDRPRPAVQTHTSAIHEVELPAALSVGLAGLYERANVTPFMALFAATATALAQTRELREVVMGTAVANRSRPELEELIGCLVNTVVLRLDVHTAQTFTDLLTQTRTLCTEAYAHAEVPFERVVQEVQPERSASHLPLFQTWFVVQEDHDLHGAFADLDVVSVGTPPRMARYDLRLQFNRTPTSLTLICEYKSDLFTSAGITRLAEHVTRVLETVIGRPDAPQDALVQLLAEADTQRRLQDTEAAEGYSLNALGRHRRRRDQNGAAVNRDQNERGLP